MAATAPSSQTTLHLRSINASQSRNQSQTQTLPHIGSNLRQPVLHLRGSVREPGQRSERRIQWAEDVIDNEGLGRKSSKVCCIYHAPKAIDESSDESSSDSSDSSSDESGNDDGGARMAGGKRGRGKRGGDKDHKHGHGHEHDHSDDCAHGNGPAGAPRKAKARTRARSPNAYEKMPKVKEGVSGAAR